MKHFLGYACWALCPCATLHAFQSSPPCCSTCIGRHASNLLTLEYVILYKKRAYPARSQWSLFAELKPKPSFR